MLGKSDTSLQFRDKDQFYTNPEISRYCYQKALAIMLDLDLDPSEYTFIEPSAGCCNFYELLPDGRRI